MELKRDFFRMNLIVPLAICFVCFNSTLGLRPIALYVPPYVREDHKVTFQCMFDLEGDVLYAVKWYYLYGPQDPREFFRYTQKDNPPMKQWPIDGINLLVNHQLSNSTHLIVDNANREMSGQYSCEVTVEQSYQTFVRNANVTVVRVPVAPPTITVKHRGETLTATCQSAPSYPAANLTFFIGHTVKDKRFIKRIKVEDGMLVSTLTLRVSLAKHLSDKFRCIATIANLYNKSAEKLINRVVHTTPNPVLTALPGEHVPHTTLVWKYGPEEQNSNRSNAAVACKFCSIINNILISIVVIVINSINYCCS